MVSKVYKPTHAKTRTCCEALVKIQGGQIGAWKKKDVPSGAVPFSADQIEVITEKILRGCSLGPRDEALAELNVM